MTWSIHTHNIKRIDSFETAEKVWNDSKPWKGQDESWRPLDNQRMTHKRLVKRSGSYDCVLYNTAIVSYHSDHTNLRFYSTHSTVAFAWCVCPTGCSMVSSNGAYFWKVETPEGDRYYTKNGQLTFDRVSNGIWKLDGQADEQKEWVYDRKLGAAARRILKPYKTWFDVTSRLGGLPLFRRIGPTPSSEAIDLFLESFDDTSTFPEMFSFLGSPDTVLAALYLHNGARYATPVPNDRLPKRQTS